jgi:3-methylcrotonyl-CoA carboxylase alpha subunit
LIDSLLIANRGEIAVRIATTAARLGVQTIGVFTDPDADALHVHVVDAAVHIDDHLDGAALIEAAKSMGADAIHPGFGFLAESAEFASSVIEAGLVWVGPPPSAIAAMGSKAAARTLMSAAGVPVLPGYDGDDQGDAALAAAAAEIGWPVIIKASAGGGGKGMQVVESEGEFPAALSEARRIAAAAFGDDRMIIERYLPLARHVEVQVFADEHGHCIHLWERECSIQRRHQKVIEEAPSPAFEGEGGEQRRADLLAHAVRAAKAVQYVGAGTVEFVLDETGTAFFLEMNTRIQVEHPVTEAITGLDLVELQIRVASGEALPLEQSEVRCEGWAIEARIYAEDPDQNYLPSTGTLHRWRPPAGVRVDSGVREGSEITMHFDPMLAKVIAHAPSRELARVQLAGALASLDALGVRTNRAHLGRVLRHSAFKNKDLSTRFLEIHSSDLGPTDAGIGRAKLAVLVHEWLCKPKGILPGLRKNWRNSRWRDVRFNLSVDGEECAVSLSDMGDHLVVDGHEVRVLSSEDELRLEVDGVVMSAAVVSDGSTRWVRTMDGDFVVALAPRFIPVESVIEPGSVSSPMQGTVAQVLVSEGDIVKSGDGLVVIEAMKMEQTLRAPEDGVVAELRANVGDQVAAGTILVVLAEG